MYITLFCNNFFVIKKFLKYLHDCFIINIEKNSCKMYKNKIIILIFLIYVI